VGIHSSGTKQNYETDTEGTSEISGKRITRKATHARKNINEINISLSQKIIEN
jgi:hypothetical protein